MLSIKYVDYGIGSHCGDYIEINRNLIGYPELHKEVYQHEQQHTKGFKLKEFLKEFYITYNPKLYIWMFKHPRSFLNFFPYRNGYWDVHLILFYIIMGVGLWIVSNLV